MFIISLTYLVELSDVDHYLDEHIDFLNECYKQEIFLASGPKVPRTGGVIFAKAKSQNTLLDTLQKDPFWIHNIAQYDIIEFTPNRAHPQLDYLL